MFNDSKMFNNVSGSTKDEAPDSKTFEEVVMVLLGADPTNGSTYYRNHDHFPWAFYCKGDGWRLRGDGKGRSSGQGIQANGVSRLNGGSRDFKRGHPGSTGHISVGNRNSANLSLNGKGGVLSQAGTKGALPNTSSKSRRLSSASSNSKGANGGLPIPANPRVGILSNLSLTVRSSASSTLPLSPSGHTNASPCLPVPGKKMNSVEKVSQNCDTKAVPDLDAKQPTNKIVYPSNVVPTSSAVKREFEKEKNVSTTIPTATDEVTDSNSASMDTVDNVEEHESKLSPHSLNAILVKALREQNTGVQNPRNSKRNAQWMVASSSASNQQYGMNVTVAQQQFASRDQHPSVLLPEPSPALVMRHSSAALPRRSRRPQSALVQNRSSAVAGANNSRNDTWCWDATDSHDAYYPKRDCSTRRSTLGSAVGHDILESAVGNLLESAPGSSSNAATYNSGIVHGNTVTDGHHDGNKDDHGNIPSGTSRQILALAPFFDGWSDMGTKRRSEDVPKSMPVPASIPKRYAGSSSWRKSHSHGDGVSNNHPSRNCAYVSNSELTVLARRNLDGSVQNNVGSMNNDVDVSVQSNHHDDFHDMNDVVDKDEESFQSEVTALNSRNNRSCDGDIPIANKNCDVVFPNSNDASVPNPIMSIRNHIDTSTLYTENLDGSVSNDYEEMKLKETSLFEYHHRLVRLEKKLRIKERMLDLKELEKELIRFDKTLKARMEEIQRRQSWATGEWVMDGGNEMVEIYDHYQDNLYSHRKSYDSYSDDSYNASSRDGNPNDFLHIR